MSIKNIIDVEHTLNRLTSIIRPLVSENPSALVRSGDLDNLSDARAFIAEIREASFALDAGADPLDVAEKLFDIFHVSLKESIAIKAAKSDEDLSLVAVEFVLADIVGDSVYLEENVVISAKTHKPYDSVKNKGYIKFLQEKHNVAVEVVESGGRLKYRAFLTSAGTEYHAIDVDSDVAIAKSIAKSHVGKSHITVSDLFVKSMALPRKPIETQCEELSEAASEHREATTIQLEQATVQLKEASAQLDAASERLEEAAPILPDTPNIYAIKKAGAQPSA